jgi:hypothetical protein
MATHTWDGLSGGWSIAANWSPNGVPGANDTADITAPGSYTVTVTSGTVGPLNLAGTLNLVAISGNLNASSFQQAGGTIGGTGTLTVTGAATFAGGTAISETQTGGGTTLLQGATTDQGAYLYLDGGRVLKNTGTFNAMMNGFFGFISLGSNPRGPATGVATIENAKGATFDIRSSFRILDNSPAVTGKANHFVNSGTLEMTGVGGAATIAPALNNTGSVSVQAGTLTFTGGGQSSGGTFWVASGATLVFAGGGAKFTSTNDSFVGYGTVDIAGGEVDFSGSNSSAALFEQTGGVIGGGNNLVIHRDAMFAGSDVQTGFAETILVGDDRPGSDDLSRWFEGTR